MQLYDAALNKLKNFDREVFPGAYELNSMLEDLTGEKVDTVKEMETIDQEMAKICNELSDIIHGKGEVKT